MTGMEDAQLEALKREFEEKRTRVWTDPSIPHNQKQPRVHQLWREFDARRTDLREGAFQGGTGGESVSPITGRPMMFPRKQHRPWR